MTQAHPPTILIVEDDMLFQSIYQNRLAQDGYRVKAASNGEDALREMEASPPDLVLLDLVLPQLNGYEVLSRMKADPQLTKIPVIVLSNKGEPEDVKRGLELGATDYLVKTMAHPKEVAWKIRQAISERAGEPVRLRAVLRERELDAPRLADLAGKPTDLHCPNCATGLQLEFLPRSDKPGWFDTHFVCPKCDK
jgi:DNA-binding response OmpR family regulator